MSDESKLIECKYHAGVYGIKQMCDLVDKEWITEEEFHLITSYDYSTMKEKIKGTK
jgi:hypothetical protein